MMTKLCSSGKVIPMNEALWEAIKNYIDARIEEMIKDDHGRCDVADVMRTNVLEKVVTIILKGD